VPNCVWAIPIEMIPIKPIRLKMDFKDRFNIA